MQQRPLSCWQCGTVLSIGGGRCPACGAPQAPSTADASQAGFTEREPESEPDRRRSSGALPWIALAAGLAIIGAGAALLRPHAPAQSDAPARSTGPATSPAAAVAPSAGDLGSFDPKAVDPMEILGKAKTRALAWSKDALLVSMRASPVVSGRVDISTGGVIEYLFGKPTGEGLGPGAKVAGKRLRVALSGAGTQIGEAAGAAARAALEPNCPLDAAAHAAFSAGLPPETPLLAVYDVTEKPVWHISSSTNAGVKRLIDGMSCAVLVAR